MRKCHLSVRQNRSRRDHQQNERRFRAELCENHGDQNRAATQPSEAPGSDCKQLRHRSRSIPMTNFFLIIPERHRRMDESNQKMLRCSRRRNGKQAHNGWSIRENPERKLYLTSMFTCCLSCFRKLCFLREQPLQACRRLRGK